MVTDCAVSVHNGDKVLAELTRRGTRHADHRAKITAVFGCSDQAAVCAEALLYINGIEVEFPNAVLDEARYAEHKGIATD